MICPNFDIKLNIISHYFVYINTKWLAQISVSNTSFALSNDPNLKGQQYQIILQNESNSAVNIIFGIYLLRQCCIYHTKS